MEWEMMSIGRLGGEREADRRETGISFSLPLYLSFPSPCVSAYCRLQQFHNPRPASQQPSRPCCSVPLTHERQQYNNRKGPPLLSLAGPVSKTPCGWILLLSLLTMARAEINLQHSKILCFVYEMVLQEQINWGFI